MSKAKAEKIFKKYNRQEDVVRCPRGQAETRELLDQYVRALLNLNGVIEREQVVNIFNEQNDAQINSDDIYTLLLPKVFKDRPYWFYKGFLVHYIFNNIPNEIDALVELKEDKPYYLPEKAKLLKYSFGLDMYNESIRELRAFLFESQGYNLNTVEAADDLIINIVFAGSNTSTLSRVLEEYQFEFKNEAEVQSLLNVYMQANNNTRIWINNGFTPSELADLIAKQKSSVIPRQTIQKKIARNKPCPCGSGKKYKHCCGEKEILSYKTDKNAFLSDDECRLFYETWFGLMSFVNEKRQVIKGKVWTQYPEADANSNNEIYPIREVLWKEPELIGEYLNEVTLPKEKREIIESWQSSYREGPFILYKYERDYAVLIVNSEEKGDILVGLKQLVTPISDMVTMQPPIFIETVLLPFKDKIVYDCYISEPSISFSKNMRDNLDYIYAEALKKGVFTSLE